jgi:Uma2 family endonuclease
MPETGRLVTAEELEKFPDDDYRYELVEGRLIRMSPVGLPHGEIVMNIGARLLPHVRRQGLGLVVTEVGFTLKRNPDTVRAPDVAFIRRDRLPADRRGFYNGPPDLAIEVLSPDDTRSEVRDKVAEYLACGVPLVIVVDPDEQSATVSRPTMEPVRLSGNDVLDLSDIVDGFSCHVQELFE